MKYSKEWEGIPRMKPSQWGPSGWDFLHSIASTFPEHPTPQEKQDYEIFFKSLGSVLPCKACRPHYHDYILQHPLTTALTSRKTLVYYLFHFHNHVNRRLGKPILHRSSLPQYFTPSPKNLK